MSTTTDRVNQFLREVAPRLTGLDTDRICAWLHNRGFFDAPASTRYHGAWPGGLFDHSLGVMQQLVLLTERNGLTWECPESPYIVGFFHDICKPDQYTEVRQEDGKPVYAWNSNTLFKGHGEKSVLLLASLGISLTEEEVTCIRYHMGAFTDKELWGDYTRAMEKYPNVLWTHTADMIVSHVYNK